MITSKENETIKHIKSLNQKKYRDEYGEYFIEGVKMVQEAIDEKMPIRKIILCEELLPQKIDTQNYEVEYVDQKVFTAITDTVSPQGILAVMAKQEKVIFSDEPNIIFALDDVQDPGNVGTIIRTLDCAGIHDVMVSEKSADVYNPKVVRSTMGAIFRVSVHEATNLIDALHKKQQTGYQIIVTSLDATSYYDTLNFETKAIIVIGNESKGVRPEIQQMADIKTKIPMLGKTESLNASVAASLMAYEYVRKK